MSSAGAPPARDPRVRADRALGERFGRTAAVVACAPGRVNLIGEHTDYNEGYVLPTVIPEVTAAALAPRDDGRVRVWSEQGGTGAVEYRAGAETRGQGWLDYVQGVTWALAEAGHAVAGFDLAIASDVPVGAGLSSSAALEIAVVRGLTTLWPLALDELTVARLAQRAEVGFVGAPVGILDQMACHVADATHALFLDTRTLAYERVPLPPHVEFVIVNSGVAHDHARGDYRTRRAECERAAALLGVRALRDVAVSDLGRVMALPEPLGRRARHIITENQRVLDAVAAMRAGDLARLGELFYASHASQRDDFEVSVPEVDRLVERARQEPATLGARLTGGGFGGSIVVLKRV